MSVLEELNKLIDLVPIVKKLRALPDRVDALEEHIKELETGKASNNFIDHDGLLLKRNLDGSLARAVFCPKCKISVDIDEEFGRAICTCGWAKDITYSQLDALLAKLQNKCFL